MGKAALGCGPTSCGQVKPPPGPTRAASSPSCVSGAPCFRTSACPAFWPTALPRMRLGADRPMPVPLHALEFALRRVRVERRLAAMRFLVWAWRLIAGPRQVGRAVQPLHHDVVLQFAVGTDRCQETVGPVGRYLHEGLFRLHLDGADLALADAAGAAQHRDQPAWLGILPASDRQREPDAGAEIVAAAGRLIAACEVFARRSFTRRRERRDFQEIFRRRAA